MKDKELKKKTKKTAKATETKKPAVKTIAKPASATAKKTVKKVSPARAVTKPEKISKPETPKKKTIAKKKISAAVTKKVAGEKKTVKETKKTGKAPKPKTTAKKPVAKPTEKAKVKVKAKIKAKAEVKEKITEKAKVKPKVKTKERTKAVKKKKEAAPIIETPKQVTRPVKKLTKKKKVAFVETETKPVELEKAPLKIFLPEEVDETRPWESIEEESQEVPFFELPEEYGENELLLMAVEPNIIFASWEIKKGDILKVKDPTRRGEGILNLRAYDVTGVEFDGTNAHAFIDIKIDNRVGSDFFDIKMHGKDVIIEIGLLSADGKFKAILRSNTVSIPRLLVPDEFGIAQKLYEAGVPFGY